MIQRLMVFTVASVCCLGPVAAAEIDFNRDIRPILSNKCFACHGPDANQRKAKFRLDKKESAFGTAESGEHVIVPGKLDQSELVARITTDDADLQMPPADSKKSLKPEEIELLKQWVASGAEWSEHWAFITPTKPALPKVQNKEWCETPIDYFILNRLEQEKLKPNGQAAKESLIRRVTFDLTGLPPTLLEIDAFLADTSSGAFEKVVDRLLKSEHFGEHMARFWLDAARYGDTHGLHLDNYREMWPYRDWVVDAFNRNMPFDQFTAHQIAGDLLADADDDSRVASGYNRCHVTTSEGGSIAEEVYVRNVVDRVTTTATVFMGLTFECTRCHDHKFDPFTMTDFYSMFAFFNNLDGNPLDGNKSAHAPVLRVTSKSQRAEVARLQQLVAATRVKIKDAVAAYKYVEPNKPTAPKPVEPTEFVWIDDDAPSGAQLQGDTPWQWVEKPQPVFSGKRASTRSAGGRSQHFFTGAKDTLQIGKGDVLFAYVYLDKAKPTKEIMLQFNDGKWEHRAYWGGNHIDWGKDKSPSRFHAGALPKPGEWTRLEVPAEKVGLQPGARLNGWAFTQFDGTVFWDKAGIISKESQQSTYDSFAQWTQDKQADGGSGLPDDLKAIVKAESSKRPAPQTKQLLDYFVEHALTATRATFDPLHKTIADTEKQVTAVQAKGATTLVFKERADIKPAYILTRGEYEQRGKEVSRATPSVLPPLPKSAPVNRLGFAQWLTDRSHPLTARVAVNRIWQQMFGTGIVRTSEDFGSQGEQPSHPQLLDWLAVQFMDEGWDVKQTMKRMVMSAVYQQSTNLNPTLLERDPANRLLARGPRFRMAVEMIRDQALAVSGLLNRELGGPSVKPPQPDGLWFAVGYSGSNTVRFKADAGPGKVHRRALYTFIKRTAPPPQMSTFDAPSREACMMRRERTNTPLQALLLMNDPQFVECARGLATQVCNAESDPAKRAALMLRSCTSHSPTSEDIQDLVDGYSVMLKVYQANPEAAAALLKIGESPVDPMIDAAQLAAWTVLANTVLNMDAVLTKG